MAGKHCENPSISKEHYWQRRPTMASVRRSKNKQQLLSSSSISGPRLSSSPLPPPPSRIEEGQMSTGIFLRVIPKGIANRLTRPLCNSIEIPLKHTEGKKSKQNCFESLRVWEFTSRRKRTLFTYTGRKWISTRSWRSFYNDGYSNQFDRQ